MSNTASDATVSFSSKVGYRAVIQYLYLKGKTGQEIHCKLTNVYGSSTPSYAQVKFWVGEFNRSRTSLEDETRSGHPSDATDEEMCNKVWDLVYSDRRVKNATLCWQGDGNCILECTRRYYVGLSSKELQ